MKSLLTAAVVQEELVRVLGNSTKGLEEEELGGGKKARRAILAARKHPRREGAR